MSYLEGMTALTTRARMRQQHRVKNEHFKIYKNPKESAIAVGLAAEKKVSWAMDKYFVLAIMSGVYVGFGGTAAFHFAAWFSASPGISQLAFAAVYPIGLYLVLLLGGELFTGNLMYFTFARLQKNVTPFSCAFALVSTFVLNWAGVALTAYLIGVLGEMFTLPLQKNFVIKLALTKVAPPWYVLMLRGIPANFLACTSIFTFKSAEDILSKIFAIWVPTMVFLLAGLEHCVTNMLIGTLGILIGAPFSYWRLFYWNLLPVALGNFIGGGILVGAFTFYLYSFGEDPLKIWTAHPGKSFQWRKWSFLERRQYTHIWQPRYRGGDLHSVDVSEEEDGEDPNIRNIQFTNSSRSSPDFERRRSREIRTRSRSPSSYTSSLSSQGEERDTISLSEESERHSLDQMYRMSEAERREIAERRREERRWYEKRLFERRSERRSLDSYSNPAFSKHGGKRSLEREREWRDDEDEESFDERSHERSLSPPPSDGRRSYENPKKRWF